MIEDADLDRFIEGLISGIRTSKLVREVLRASLEEIDEHMDGVMKTTARSLLDAAIMLVQTTESRIEIARALRQMREAVDAGEPQPLPAGTSN